MSNHKMWKKRIIFKGRYKRDSMYKSYWIRKFINKMTKQGKKHKFEIMLYDIFIKSKDFIYPLFFFFQTLSKSKWRLTTQLKRLGKFFHSIPTYIPFPRSYGHGIMKLKKVLEYSKNEKSFSKALYLEMYNLKFARKNSLSIKLKKKKFLLIRKNRPYTHYRWK